MEIFKANSQWATRPEDERFTSLQAMHDACLAYAGKAREAEVAWNTMRFEAVGDDLQLLGRTGVPAALSHYAFGQLAQRASAPEAYLRTLPPTLAAQNLNFGLAKRSDDAGARLLFHDRNGSGLLLRAATSDIYERVWNHEVTQRLLELESRGWQAASPDFTFDLPHSADPDLYASDHDMFAFIRHPDRVIDDGTQYGLRRGIIVANSEVGDCSLSATYFLYRYQCGNHIIWGAQDVKEIRVAHRGQNVRRRFDGYVADLSTYLDRSASDEEAMIQTARVKLLGQTKEQVLDVLFAKATQLDLTRKQITAGVEATVEEEDGDPRTVWGVVQGLTRYSQTLPFADERTAVDKAAGKVLKIAF
jgi:uncharacterized protein DUF932